MGNVCTKKEDRTRDADFLADKIEQSGAYEELDYENEENVTTKWNVCVPDDIDGYWDEPLHADEDFPEANSSLDSITVHGKEYKPCWAKKDWPKGCGWASAQVAVMTCNTTEFASLWQGVEVGDITQGGLGDCWWISAIAGVCNLGEAYITDCFPYNDDGTLDPENWYTVRLFDIDNDNEEVYIELNDHVPIQVNENGVASPGFAKPTSGEIYVMLLEKSLAKFLGSYAACASGHTFAGYQYLIGCETHTFYEVAGPDIHKYTVYASDVTRTNYSKSEDLGVYDPEDAWAEILEAITTWGALGSAAWDGEGMETQADNGLVYHHAYTVAQAVESSDERNGHPIRLLQCRNPWGSKKEWGCNDPSTCDWSDGNDLWAEYPDTADLCGYEGGRADGLFWMSWTDFQEFGREIVLSWVP